MTTAQVVYNPITKEVKIQMPGDAPGAGFTDLGDCVHTDPIDPLGNTVNHVMWHHVRDELYLEGQLDMSLVTIQDTKLTGLSSLPATVTKAPAATQQITNTFTPADASNRNVTYTTSDASKATVSDTGLITAVATGTATITITSNDGAFTDTCVVTIS